MVVFLALLVLVLLERAIELDRSRKHVRALLARGGVERGRGHYALVVIAHAAFYVAWTVETWLRRPEAGLWTAAWIGLFALLQAARLWTTASLGERWTTRIVVLPFAPLVRRGPYRWIRHPNYVIVVLEIATLAIAFRAWATLALGLALQAAALAVRIRTESAALGVVRL